MDMPPMDMPVLEAAAAAAVPVAVEECIMEAMVEVPMAMVVEPMSIVKTMGVVGDGWWVSLGEGVRDGLDAERRELQRWKMGG